jgi:hypothetical protein
MMTLFDRARGYVAAMPEAISGQGGHQATFAVAVALIHGFALSDDQAWSILCEYNSRCSPPWRESELRHKLEDAGKLTRHPQPRGHLSGITHRHAVGISLPHVRVYKMAPLFDQKPPENKATELSITSKEPEKDAVAVADEPELTAERLAEAQRIAAELAKLAKHGAFNGADDPEAKFYATVIRTFGGTYVSVQKPAADTDECHTPPSMKASPRS